MQSPIQSKKMAIKHALGFKVGGKEEGGGGVGQNLKKGGEVANIWGQG